MSSTNVTVFCIGAHTRTDFVNDICTGATDVRDLAETSCSTMYTQFKNDL